jgi:hypothetical protein
MNDGRAHLFDHGACPSQICASLRVLNRFGAELAQGGHRALGRAELRPMHSAQRDQLEQLKSGIRRCVVQDRSNPVLAARDSVPARRIGDPGLVQLGRRVRISINHSDAKAVDVDPLHGADARLQTLPNLILHA